MKMNQITEEHMQSIKCNQKSATTKNKNKKTKDRPETSDAISLLNEDKLSEVLVNTLHINNINSNITNGTNDHIRQDSSHDLNIKCIKEDESPSENSKDVDNVQCSQTTGNGTCEAINTSQTLKGYVFEEALENLNKSIVTQETTKDEIEIISYESEIQMPEIMRLIQKDLSEPYSIYTYRYFIHNWPKLCFLAIHEGKCIGAIVCKLDMHRNVVKRGYIAMLAVDERYRNKKIGSRLVRKAIQVMIDDNADEVVLETEITNKPALKLYENLGFVKDKRLFRYYLNGVDALRLKLWLR